MTKIAFLFPGQGAQSVGMGRELAHSCPAAEALYQQANELLGYDLAKICFEGPAEVLDATNHCQPALFVTSLAALEWLRSESPQIVEASCGTAGLSLGEYTALVHAGAIDFPTGLQLVAQRGEAMQQAADASPGGMVSILGLAQDQVESLCLRASEGETLMVANLLCPGNIVVSGARTACQRVAGLAEEAGAMKAIPLAVAGAFHTPLMDPAAARLADVIQDATIDKPTFPVVLNVDGQPHDQPDAIRQRLVQQVVRPVRWEDSMRQLISQGFDRFYEIGPGRVLRGLLKRIDRKLTCETVAA